MSILIKGMEMPENCHECKFVDILPTCPCNKMEDEDFWNNVSLAVEGHKDCPLVPVPPHGRLIDADAADDYAYDELEISYSYLSPREASRNMQLIYRNMPTIIPAEEGET